MNQPHKRLFLRPVEDDAPPPPPPPDGREGRRERRRRKLHLFSVIRNAFALLGAAFLVVELLRYVIIPYVLVPLSGAAGG